MNDLDTRLRELTDLSPPARAPLGADELHQRASSNRRRALALRAVPAAMVVVVLLAGAMALRSRDVGSDITLTTPDPAVTTNTGLSERDQEMVGFLATTAELRHQLNRESVLTAVSGGSTRTSGEDELGAQRVATDRALDDYREALAVVRPGESPTLDEAIKQADNRLARLDILRRSVDEAETEIYDTLDGYTYTVASLGDLPLQYLQGAEQPALIRGLLTASNYGTFAELEAATASDLTVAVEVGYFPFTLDLLGGAGPSPSGSGVPGCNGDAAAAGDACKAFAEPMQRRTETDHAESTFLNFATAQQKMLARSALAGDVFGELMRAAFEDGIGQNDLRGTTPSSQAIDPVEWRAAALGHIDRMAEVERQLYEMIGTAAAEPDQDAVDERSSEGTAPSTTSSAPEAGPASSEPPVASP